MSSADVWPAFLSTEITKSSSDQYNISCPYILSKKVLGTGSYSHVYECKNTMSGAHYAAKQYSKKLIYGMELMLQSEFQVLKAVLNGHRNILLMVDYFETLEYFYLVTDLANGGELFDRITSSPDHKLPVRETRRILATLLLALVHLHGNNVVHRDIKAENILFASRSSSESLLLLADFGHAKILGHDAQATDCGGTLSYLAPEVVARSGHSFPVDMWAVGVLTYFMLSGYMPFDCDSDEETKQLILAADYEFEPAEYWHHIPDDAKDFMARCFEVDPAKRITLFEALRHPFIAEHPISRSVSQASMSKLQDAVRKLHKNRSMSSMATLSAKFDMTSAQSSRLSLEPLSHTLLGERCYSPETVTAFTTPISLAVVSRQHSQNSIHTLPAMKLSLSMTGRNGKANFVL